MNDTPPKIKRIYDSMMMKRTPQERIRMMSNMFDSAKLIAISSIRTTNPNISDKDLRCKLFLHFYRNDFSPLQREKILAYLQQ